MIRSDINTLIISAGYSHRMKDFKPLKKFQKLPFILNIIIKTSQICDNVYIVTGYRSENVQKVVTNLLMKKPQLDWLSHTHISIESWHQLQKKIHFIHNPDFPLGMFTSLQQGLKQMKTVDWILYHFVDQPHIPSVFYKDFVTQLSSDFQWIQPQYKNKNGHPVFIHSSLIKDILAADINDNLNNLFKRVQIRKKYWECNHPEILKDFDTESDLSEGGYVHESDEKNN